MTTATETRVWAEWNALPEHCPCPVKTIARALNMEPADVAFIVYPAEMFGVWADDQEPDPIEGPRYSATTADLVANIEAIVADLDEMREQLVGWVGASPLAFHFDRQPLRQRRLGVRPLRRLVLDRVLFSAKISAAPEPLLSAPV